MRKLDLLSVTGVLLAAAGTALYFSGQELPGQISCFVAAVLTFALTKKLGAYLQGYSAITAFILLGLACGGWMLAVAMVLAYSSVNLRLHIFREAIYSRMLWTEPVLAFMALVVYISANLLHDNGWPGWVFPGFFVLLGNLLSWMNSNDRRNIQRLLEQGVINIGVEAPDFTLKDEENREVTLSSYEGSRSVLLLFVRGDWCPGCHIMLRMYERERKRFHEKNVMLLAIGPDPVGVNKAMVEKLGMDYRILSDENMQTARKYCVQVQEEAIGAKLENGIPLPASFLICDKGIVRYTSRADNAGEFLRPEVIFDVLSKI